MKVFTSVTMILTLLVIGLGAFTRLMDAGLGCPDWPGCYGHWFLPSLEELEKTLSGFDKTQEVKAWVEMIHRYVAGFLGVLMVALGLTLFLKGRSPWLGLLLILLTIFQAALGMWTVTKQLNPIIVSLHLLGGISLFLSLVSILSKEFQKTHLLRPHWNYQALIDLTIAFYMLQLFLGAWVSTNYAALSCQGLLTCDIGKHLSWPNIASLFDFIGLWGAPEPLAFYSLEQKAHIQILHRGNAIVLGIFIMMLHQFYRPAALKEHRAWIDLMLILYLAQLSIGLILVIFQLPLPLAVVHNVLAALLGVPIFWLKFQQTRQHVG